MEAANRGAIDAGGKSSALTSVCPLSNGRTRYITPELSFEFHYFFMRKFWFAYPAKAMVIFPGGFGTLDELFEMLTLMQTQKIESKYYSASVRHRFLARGRELRSVGGAWE